MKKFIAFTLAETLVVIGIIGVVSALTLPNLNNSTSDKEKVVKVKKIYQNLNDAIGRAVAKYGPFGTWLINDTTDVARAKRIGERMTEFMTLSKTCGTGTGCFTSGKTKRINGTEHSKERDSDTTHSYKFITADGTSMAVVMDAAESVHAIYIDIDGPTKGSYTFGKDVFVFRIDENQILPFGNNYTFEGLLSEITTVGQSATAWITRYDNADYLKISSVSGSTATCTGGAANAVTESNPRCK